MCSGTRDDLARLKYTILAKQVNLAHVDDDDDLLSTEPKVGSVLVDDDDRAHGGAVSWSDLKRRAAFSAPIKHLWWQELWTNLAQVMVTLHLAEKAAILLPANVNAESTRPLGWRRSGGRAPPARALR